MYKDSSCRRSQPPATAADASRTSTDPAEAAVVAATAVDDDATAADEEAVRAVAETSVSVEVDADADVEAALSCLSESSSDSDSAAAPSQSRPSNASASSSSATHTTSTTSTSPPSTATPPPTPRPGQSQSQRRPLSRRHSRPSVDANADVRLLRKIGYIASRVRFLAKLYGDFRLVNPYSPAKQRRQLHEILLHHSIGGPPAHLLASASAEGSPTPASSAASSYCCLPTESSCDDETTTLGTVRRQSTPAAPGASIVLLEDLLIQFYEDHRNKVTVIRRRRSRRNSATNATAANGSANHLVIMSGQTSSSVERLLQLANDNDLEDEAGELSEALASDLVAAASVDADNMLQKRRNFFNANANANVGGGATSQSTAPRSNAFLQPSSSCEESTRRRRSSDCSTHPGQPLSNQLQVTLKNNNCAKFPFHRGSCGAAGEHLLAANSIANRSTIILSKSCSNVDGSAGGDLRSFARALAGNGAAVGAATNGNGNNGNGTNGNGNNGNNGNGANKYSVVQLNNTIIQCHFNDDDFRALVKDLKRKVEYTERMNWLCLSKRPLGPPHRKSSLPKHQEVKKRFLEICDTTFSDEVKAALRLPAFDSYEWSDADVIHLMQTMFVELGFIEKFHIPPETLREWLYEVYKHYNEVPFHNFRHCFCVAQMMYAITRQANLLQRLGDLECLILLVSCICHDLDHPGYNNIYQINARTELALRYNDISPLENHHCSIAFRLLEHPECNIFKNFSRETFNIIREGIIRCILATDMARHNEILTQFKEVTPIFDYSNRSHINLLCMILIKVADISNEARPMDVAEPWLDRLLQEFFAQSAAEKSEGLPVTPFMDPDKVSKPGSQVRFIGLVLLPLFEALGDLVPELTELIIIPVRVALDYYKRLNDAQNKSRKSVVEGGSNAVSESNSCDAATASGSGSGSAQGGGGGGAASANSGGSISPQMPRSQSGISVKSRRSIPSQKSASRTSVDEPTCIAAELHDLPEGSESGDSETATEVDVAEKTSKFKVDTEGSSNRSKSSHSTSRKSSREKRPSMIGEMCSSGGGQRIRNSYGNIHGYHSNRCHFGSNRAVSLDQYSCNNRRLSDGLQQVISDSNVFYNRHNRCSLDTGGVVGDSAHPHKLGEDLNSNATVVAPHQLQPSPSSSSSPQQPHQLLQQHHQQQLLQQQQHQPPLHLQPHVCGLDAGCGRPVPNIECAVSAASLQQQEAQARGHGANGNCSPTQPAPPKQHCCAAAAAAAAAASSANGAHSPPSATGTGSAAKGSWKARFKQFSDYFSFSFDKGAKRFGSTRSSPCSVRNNNAVAAVAADSKASAGVCCTISNNLQSPGLLLHNKQQELVGAGRHRAYSLDVPCSRSNPRYSSSSGGESRKSSRNEDTSHRGLSGSIGTGTGTGTGTGGGANDDNNSNNTLHSSGGAGSEMPICLPPPIRIGSVDASDTILIATGLPCVITPTCLGAEAEQAGLGFELGLAGADPPRI